MNYKNILLLLLGLEIIYFILSFFYPIRTQLELLTNIASPTSANTQQNPLQAYNDYSLKKIQSIQIPSAILTNKYEGTLIDMTLDTKENTLYPLILKLRAKNNAENIFIFTKSQLATVKTYEKGKGSLSLDTIKPGDFLQIQEEIDLNKNWQNARKEFIITVIK